MGLFINMLYKQQLIVINNAFSRNGENFCEVMMFVRASSQVRYFVNAERSDIRKVSIFVNIDAASRIIAAISF
jgi:hypothetical protein